MAFAGLGSWLGTAKRNATTSPAIDASEANSLRRASHERNGNESDASRGKESNSSIGDSIYVGAPDNANDETIAQNFHIDLPVISDSEDFEHLPGHFAARHVLSRLRGPKERFRVKLQSDETQTVCNFHSPLSQSSLISPVRFSYDSLCERICIIHTEGRLQQCNNFGTYEIGFESHLLTTFS